jgi:hypothetical protein
LRRHNLATSQSVEIEKGQLAGMANVKRACEGSFLVLSACFTFYISSCVLIKYFWIYIIRYKCLYLRCQLIRQLIQTSKRSFPNSLPTRNRTYDFSPLALSLWSHSSRWIPRCCISTPRCALSCVVSHDIVVCLSSLLRL